jgi:hypothetical protein
METKYEYGIAKRNDGLYTIYRITGTDILTGENVYEYLHEGIKFRGEYNKFVFAWGGPMGAWTSYKGMPKEDVVKLLNEWRQYDIDSRLRSIDIRNSILSNITGAQIEKQMSVEYFLKNED